MSYDERYLINRKIFSSVQKKITESAIRPQSRSTSVCAYARNLLILFNQTMSYFRYQSSTNVIKSILVRT